MHTRANPSHGSCLSWRALQTATTEDSAHLLGALCYTADSLAPTATEQYTIPLAHVATPPLGENKRTCELWQDENASDTRVFGPIRYRCTQDLLFGIVVLDESGIAPSLPASPLQQAAEHAYQQIFLLLDEMNYGHLVRCWNYIADINGHSFGLERYRQFNLGRQDAFLARGRNVERSAPAACALGATTGPLTIAFLASKTPAINIENPRQVSAYDYPEQYGPRSPTFSRASLLVLPRKSMLFISGTASIVGHETVHAGDVAAQTRETMANIGAVLEQANRGGSNHRLGDFDFKVYVRHSADLATVKDELAKILGTAYSATFLHADICRDDLLVEIEATAESPAAPATKGCD